MSTVGETTSAELVAAAAAGDSAAWRALVDRYTGLVWSVARGFRLSQADAGDVVQTTWLRLVEHLDRLTEPERVGGWLATTARRECLQTLRRSGRETVTEPGDAFDIPTQADPLDAALLASERDALLWQAFGGLSAPCQRLLRVLMADPPPHYDEVSAALDMPIGSIGPTRGRCLAKLRDLARDVGITDSGRSS